MFCVFIFHRITNRIFRPLLVHRPTAQRAERKQSGSVLVRRKPIARFRWYTHPQLSNQTDADLVQAPPAPNDEVLLCNQSESGRQGPETAGAENGTLQAGATGRRASHCS